MTTAPAAGQRPQLITVERVSVLNRVEFFNQAPGHVLASVARIADEVPVERGQRIIERGEVGDALFVVVRGRLRVHVDDHTVAEIGPGDVVGELAVLAPEPRTASVTALDRGLLLRIRKAAFDELLLDRPEIARGIITTLVERFRERNDALAAPPAGS